MTRSANPASWFVAALGTIGLGGLLVITLASPGATRMHAGPWSLAYAVTLIVPALLLLSRTCNSREPLKLPSRGWTLTILALAVGVLSSALASPWRGPALLWSGPLLAALAVYFVIFDFLHGGAIEQRRAQLLTSSGVSFALIALVSIGLWLAGVLLHPTSNIWLARNPYPLGHSNYTAGLALLMLPLFAALALRDRGTRRVGWLVALVLATIMLLTSGSRGGFVGLAVLGIVHVPALARTLRLNLWLVVAATAIVLVAAFALNPRSRTLIAGSAARATLQASDVQRSAMIDGGFKMGIDRPFLGWGPGTTPLAYPLHRKELAGGTENVLQLHNTPVQIWAELGGVPLLLVLWLIILASAASRASIDSRRVLLALSGYAVFSLTDWQLDVPVFGFALAAAGALLAPSSVLANPQQLPFGRPAVGGLTLCALIVIGLWGRPDPTPALNVRALALARDPAQATAAITLLEQSLALNPNQEIAHFNLGWLLVVRDPASAERHFLAAAQLVPDKGGVYFGLGLARLNEGHRNEAVIAFALESMNDPVFLTSPWWRDPAVAPLRAAVHARMLDCFANFPGILNASPSAPEARYLAVLVRWLDGTATPAQVLVAANTPDRMAYFGKSPTPPDFASAPIRLYRRERSGYPVLMRNLDLPAPMDLFDVQENLLATGELRFLFPAKGWVPTPRLRAWLDPNHSAR